MAELRDHAIVLFSGGQDSTTCLAWALERFSRVRTIGFAYGQTHAVELEQRGPILAEFRKHPRWKDRLANDRLVHLDLSEVAKSALLGSGPGEADDGLPPTFVPGRNLIFLTYTAIVARAAGSKNLVIGACETDFAGYPDCRNDTLMALQVTLNLGMQTNLVVHAPLMQLDKAETWGLAQDLGGVALVDLIVRLSHSCYAGNRSTRHEWGAGCGLCSACKLRAVGWNKFKDFWPEA
jgi:7-cyano-7-deazaguanine synthase